MRVKWIAFVFVILGTAGTAYGHMEGPHEFSESECAMCHLDVDNNAGNLRPILSPTCKQCHPESRGALSHPVDFLPEAALPADLPLEEDHVSCITCHFAHPFSIEPKRTAFSLLRRPGRGAAFCSACHKIRERGHIFLDSAHEGSYQAAEKSGSLDSYTLQCIECHDSRIDNPRRGFGLGKWRHVGPLKLNHPVGVSLTDVAARRRKEFNPPGLLPKEVRLFSGKIGCGTCHSAYSKDRHMLVSSNHRSRLCLRCHNK